MPNEAPIAALAKLPAVVWLKTNAVAYPLLEWVHLVAIATVFGTILIVDARILGAMRALDVRLLARNVLPWTLGGFALALLSGMTMFIARAADFISNPYFIAKLCLLFAAGANAGILHARGPLDPASAATRAQAALSLCLWMGVVFCGRWIAYA
ncbi:MAG: hypothetical protein JNK75_07650 [Betaproteobacteria bacterium]|nr:hypothetical protein [Betaproteobacteria bacterium]